MLASRWQRTRTGALGIRDRLLRAGGLQSLVAAVAFAAQ